MPQSKLSDIPVNPSDYACIDLINTTFTDHLGEGARLDRIESKQWLHWFLDRYALKPENPDRLPVDEFVALRRDLRRTLEKWSRGGGVTKRDALVLDNRISAAPLRQRVVTTADGLDLLEEPLKRDWTWVVASVAASAVELMFNGDPRRLKTCSNPSCSWMFYDGTINRSKQFCSATPCGLLIRIRRYRENQ
jgi:predicted RNA-binding Zn ribbon-like protein